MLIALSLVWVALAEPYNELLAKTASPINPDGTTIRVFGADLSFSVPGLGQPITVRGLTLHWGLVLLTALTVAATGITLKARVASLGGLWVAVFVTHWLAVGLLPHGYAWAAGAGAPTWAGRLIDSLYSIYWGLVPALIAGVWMLRYWLPQARAAQEARAAHLTPESRPTPTNGGGRAGTSGTDSDPA